MARETGERSPEIEALLGLAAAHDDADQALAHAREAHTTTRDGGYRALEGHALNRTAAIHATLGRTASAVDLARQALAIHRATGHHLGEAQARALLASVAVPQAGA